ncbi:non-ltr retroelement reverse transcriptase [Hordeum vulgare]|nr:non-ltr retroelement reverse transcriptase [Hordeum vulgare]
MLRVFFRIIVLGFVPHDDKKRNIQELIWASIRILRIPNQGQVMVLKHQLRRRLGRVERRLWVRVYKSKTEETKGQSCKDYCISGCTYACGWIGRCRGFGKIVQISGQKRKVYQPKVQVQHEVEETSPLPMILECNFTGDIFLLLRREPSTTASWVPPPAGKVMINVDAAIFTHDKSMGAGVVMREHSGSCIVCYGIGVPDVILPELAEAIAIQRGLQFALCEGIQEVLLGSDCLTVVQRVNLLDQDRSICGSVI